MPAGITEHLRKLAEAKNFAHLATINPDGSPQVSPVWIDHDGEHLLVNTATGRVKVRNIENDPRVAISIHDQENPYDAVSVQGRVVEMTTEGGDEGIDALSNKYLGRDYPWRNPAERRINLKIIAEKVSGPRNRSSSD